VRRFVIVWTSARCMVMVNDRQLLSMWRPASTHVSPPVARMWRFQLQGSSPAPQLIAYTGPQSSSLRGSAWGACVSNAGAVRVLSTASNISDTHPDHGAVLGLVT
jgi:hypothetical protein